MVASEIIKGAGAEVSIAKHGQEALDLVQVSRFDAVLMDLQMPVMDGYEATRLIRAQPGLHDLPIIALSANVMKDQVRRCYEAGMNDHLPKPVDPNVLFRLLATHLGLESKLELREDPPDQEQLVQQSLQGFPAHPAGVALSQALFYADGRVALMCKLMQRFKQEQHDVVARIRQQLELGALADAQRLAHTLKGAAGTLGATLLQEKAKQLELSIRQKQESSPRDSLASFAVLEDMEAALALVLRSLTQILASPGALAYLESETMPGDGAAYDWQEQLEHLQKLIEDYNAEAEDLVARMLVASPPAPLIEPLSEVMQAVSGFDFALAEVRMQQVRQRVTEVFSA